MEHEVLQKKLMQIILETKCVVLNDSAHSPYRWCESFTPEICVSGLQVKTLVACLSLAIFGYLYGDAPKLLS